MNNKKMVILLIVVWLLVFFSLWLTNLFVLRYPIGNSLAADFCLIPPTLRQAKLAAENASMSELDGILGAPNYGHTNLSTSSFSYDLQFGYIVTFTAWGEKLTISQISPPFTSTRWLVFPFIMALTAIVEAVVFWLGAKRKRPLPEE